MNHYKITKFKVMYQVRGNVRIWLYGIFGNARLESPIPNFSPIDLEKDDALMLLTLLKNVDPLYVNQQGIFASEVEES